MPGSTPADADPWGVFFIPRRLAPSEGFLLTHTTRGGHTPATDKGRAQSRWNAWWLPLDDRHGPAAERSYRSSKSIDELIDQLAEDHIR